MAADAGGFRCIGGKGKDLGSGASIRAARRNRVTSEAIAVVIDVPPLSEATRPQVTVRVYSSTRIDPEAQRAALDVAAAAFRAASVEVVWALCAEGGCMRALAPTDLAVRMVASGDIGPGLQALGEALIDREKQRGVLATAYVDRTLRLARQLAIDHARLLGRTVAHEVGHLLLASTTHGTGLMREVWSHDELLRARQDDWVLHPSDAQVIRRARLARPRSRNDRSGSG